MLLKNRYSIGEIVWFECITGELISAEIYAIKSDCCPPQESPVLYYSCRGMEGEGDFYLLEKEIFPSKEALEASLNKIKIGDEVYYCCLYHNKIQIRKGELLNIIETGNTYVIKRNNYSQTDHISYGYRAEIFKTEEELVNSLRDYDDKN